MHTAIALITENDIAKIDQHRIYSIYEKWPDHFKAASEIPVKLDHDSTFYSSVVLCGMGASATGADILNELMHSFGSIPSTVLKGQKMPDYVGKNTLVIVISVSGNTKESLSMFQEASKRDAEIICISSGGKLKEIADKSGHRHVMIPNLSLPRASLPYLIMPGMRIIDPLLKKSLTREFPLIFTALKKIADKTVVNVPDVSNAAKQIASFLEGGFAFCFTSPSLVHVGTRFKDSLNENAKIHCLRESVLEASHNEIVPFTYGNDYHPKVLFLGWTGDPTIVKERFKKIKQLFKDLGQAFMDINTYEQNLTSAMITSIYLLDFVTIYMAISRGIDPSPTPAIDILKGME